MKRYIIVLVMGIFCFNGCATKGPLLPYPEVPAMKKDSVTVTIDRERSIIDQAEVIRDKSCYIKDRSTFVISVPTDYVEESATKETENIRGAEEIDSVNKKIELYNTSGYFNYAEQQIEKALIRLNFRVIDRSKFEAKLREQRSRINITHTTGIIDEQQFTVTNRI